MATKRASQEQIKAQADMLAATKVAPDPLIEAATQKRDKWTTDRPPSLTQKLASVYAEVGYIEKRGRNDFHRYDYATEGDVANAIRQAFARHGVYMACAFKVLDRRDVTTKSGKIESVILIEGTFRLHDTESDEVITLVAVGEGQDGGDKAAYKAMTGATKYALMKGFLIPTGDDPEADEGTDAAAAERVSPITQKQATDLAELIAQTDTNEEAFLSFFKVDHLSELPSSKLTVARQMLRKKLDNGVAA